MDYIPAARLARAASRIFLAILATWSGLALAATPLSVTLSPAGGPFPAGSPLSFHPSTPALDANLRKYNMQAFDYTSGTNRLPFVLFVPAKAAGKPAQKFPVVVFLHGIGEVGPDLNAVFRVPAVLRLASPEFQARHPCYLLVPQHLRTDNMPWSTPVLQRAGQVLTWLCRAGTPRADADRLYVTGLSSGGFGTYQATLKLPGMFAAAVPVAISTCWNHAELTTNNVCRYWQVSNRGDVEKPIVAPVQAAFAARVRALGGELHQSLYDRDDHNAWAWAYEEPAIWEWVFSRYRGMPASSASNPALPSLPPLKGVAVKADAAPGPTPLPACHAASSCLAAGQQKPEMAVDGLMRSQFVSATPARAGDFLQVDFDRPLSGGHLQVLTGRGDGGVAVQTGVVEFSSDGRSFRTASTLRDGKAAISLRGKMVRALRVTVRADQHDPLVVREILLEP